MRHVGVVLILLCGGGCATDAQSPHLAPNSPDDSVVAFLRPTRMITADEMADAYPDRAQRGGLSGTPWSTALSSTKARHIDDCRVVSEDPPGWGFGEASIKPAKRIRWQTVNRDGQSTIGHRNTTRITLRLQSGSRL